MWEIFVLIGPAVCNLPFSSDAGNNVSSVASIVVSSMGSIVGSSMGSIAVSSVISLVVVFLSVDFR